MVALRILDACFGSDEVTREVQGLESFQADACHHLRDILEQRGGAILADSVGLGKTHVAAAIIRAELEAGGTALVVAPAQLHAHWKRHLRELQRCRWLSHTALSRGTRRVPPARFVVVDEAHAFRNPQARRYAALALLCEDARVLLLTATPVNNSLLDFYHLVRLFASRNAFADVGVPDLLAAVESAISGGSGAELRRVAEAVMVRRTRSVVTSLQPGRGAPALRFPERHPMEVVRYDLGAARAELLECVQHVIPALVFPAHAPTATAAPRELMRLGLLKRLESSTWALKASVRRHIRLLDHFIIAARDGLLFDPRGDRIAGAEVEGAVQLSLDWIALRPWPPSLDRGALLAAAEHDLQGLRRLNRLLASAASCEDPKLLRLCMLLDSCDDKVLLFTEYQETARGLWRALANRAGVALVHGSDARLGRGRSSRRAIIERFAPVANRARIARPVERVDLLIATDVLAEGLNLQDARVVVSYDLPWNPVRLAQRIGRIDRLGSPHERIRAVAFVPDRGVDELLGLMKRIRRKLRHIRIVGGDAPWSLAGMRSSTRYIEEIDAAADARELVRTMWRAAAGDGSRPEGEAPTFGVMRWQAHRDAALCCFRVGRATSLILTIDGRRPQIDTADCWNALASALTGTPGGTGGSGEGRDCTDSAAAAVAAARTAQSALRPKAPPSAARRTDHGASQAAAAVLRFLASRPGGPASEEIATADAILRRLSAEGRAGTDVRIQRLLRTATSTEDAFHSLAAEARESGSGGEWVGYVARATSGTALPDPVTTAEPRSSGDTSPMEPTAVLLLRSTQPRPE